MNDENKKYQYPSKGSVSWRTVNTGDISSMEILNYLSEEILGFNVRSEIIRFKSPDNRAFTLFMVYMNPSDIRAGVKGGSFAANYVNQINKNENFDADVVEAIKPYKIPSSIELDYMIHDPQQMKRLSDLGIIGKDFDNIKRFSNFTKIPKLGVYAILLDPQKIIRDMCADPKKDSVIGDLYITGITNGADENTIYEVTILRDKDEKTKSAFVKFANIIGR